jgi:hypothetical protein
MHTTTASTAVTAQHGQSQSGFAQASAPVRFETPRFDVISLSCEISAYAPDEGDWPRF